MKPIVADDGEVVEFVGGWRDVDSEVRAHLELGAAAAATSNHPHRPPPPGGGPDTAP